MMKVQFDIDGVLADFMFAFTVLARSMGCCDRVTGTREQTVWESYGSVPAEFVPRVWARVKEHPYFWEDVPALVSPQTFWRIEQLQFDGHEVYFATARVGFRVKDQTVQWLRKHGIGNPTVLITSRKGETAAALGANYAIDDKAGNAVFTGYQRGVRSYILDAPYNRFDSEVIGSKVRRVRTVDEFIDDVRAGK